jgi:Ras-related protein Rab-5C
MEAEVAAKVVVIGPVGVGKSSITIRYVHNEFHDSLESTLGAVYFEKTQLAQGRRVKFEFWDTAGQEKYKSIARIYYKDCRVALVVYDVTSRSSFEGLKSRVAELRTNGP